jgi:energy-coupling factor transport system substrate-specific component
VTSWQAAIFVGLALVVAGGFAWYERSRPSARLVALVAALAALAVAGRLVLAPVPNVVATTDVALLTGYALGGPPGFVVGALAAPISNIWLGQGPWTAWQMAGWGLAGLGGAWLAAGTGRRLGRWGLAFACGLAGLAYGALLDFSVMVTYGGEQSLDRYLALSARGIPFNVAHAVGNFAIAFVAGPALVRMIGRYRTRLEFRWRPVGALPTALVAVAAAAALAAAAPPRAQAADAGDAGRWLVATQNADGGFAATPGDPSSPAMTGWAMLGLEAVGINPLDVRERGRTPVSYLRSQIDRLRTPGDLERTVLALSGAGLDPRAFAGADLVARLRDQRDGDGSVDGQVNLTAFYVLGLRAAGADRGELRRPAGWLREAQNRDGGWGFRPGAPSDPDSTGAALQALAAASASGSAAADGTGWLRKAQRGNGGYALATSGVVNAQSTAWAVQGLVAAGGGGAATGKALDHLAGLRAGDGHYRYSSSSDQTPVWVTAQALLAVERRPFPLAAVARAPQAPGDPADRSAGGGQTAPPASTPSSPGLTGPVASAGGGAGAPADGGSGAPRASGGGAGGGGERGAGKDAPDAAAPQESTGIDLERIVDTLNQAEAPSAATAAAEAAESEPVTPYVAGGLGALALALGAGFFWYRRRLP